MGGQGKGGQGKGGKGGKSKWTREVRPAMSGGAEVDGSSSI